MYKRQPNTLRTALQHALLPEVGRQNRRLDPRALRHQPRRDRATAGDQVTHVGDDRLENVKPREVEALDAVKRLAARKLLG